MQTCAAERRGTRATRHAGRDPLTWANIGSADAGADTEHDGTAPDPLVVPKSIATTEKSGTKLFASAVRRLLPSVNVHRCYLVPAGMARRPGDASQGKERQRGALAPAGRWSPRDRSQHRRRGRYRIAGLPGGGSLRQSAAHPEGAASPGREAFPADRLHEPAVRRTSHSVRRGKGSGQDRATRRRSRRSRPLVT